MPTDQVDAGKTAQEISEAEFQGIAELRFRFDGVQIFLSADKGDSSVDAGAILGG